MVSARIANTVANSKQWHEYQELGFDNVSPRNEAGWFGTLPTLPPTAEDIMAFCGDEYVDTYKSQTIIDPAEYRITAVAAADRYDPDDTIGVVSGLLSTWTIWNSGRYSQQFGCYEQSDEVMIRWLHIDRCRNVNNETLADIIAETEADYVLAADIRMHMLLRQTRQKSLMPHWAQKFRDKASVSDLTADAVATMSKLSICGEGEGAVLLQQLDNWAGPYSDTLPLPAVSALLAVCAESQNQEILTKIAIAQNKTNEHNKRILEKAGFSLVM